MSKNRNVIQVAMLRHSQIPLENLRDYARRIMPKGSERKFGKSVERQKSFWAGRAILTKLLADNDWEVRPDVVYGYLRLYDRESGRTDPFFANISHTDDIAVAAIAPNPVGVDVESVSRKGDRVMKRVATKFELSHLNQNFLSRIAAPIALWSGKEAFSKALGLGMKFGFTGFEIDLSKAPPWSGKTKLKGPLQVKDPRIGILIHEDYFITVCSNGEGFETEFRFLETL